jgi:hypothetical protein
MYTNETSDVGLHGVLSDATGRERRFDIAYACQRTFTMYDQFTLLTRSFVDAATSNDTATAAGNATTSIGPSPAQLVPFESAPFGWQKQCRKPGCQELCSAHGTCNELYGQCICPPGYYGYNCETTMKVHVPSVCPGSNITISFEYPGASFVAQRSTVRLCCFFKIKQTCRYRSIWR